MATIDTLPSGKTRVRYSLGGKRTSRTFDDADEAKRFADTIEPPGRNSPVRLIGDPSPIIRLDRWAKYHWFPGVTPAVKPSTAMRYKKANNLNIAPFLGHLPLDEITPAVIRGWQARLASQGLSPASIRLARVVLGAMLRSAVLDGVIPINPVERVKGIPVEKKQLRVLPPRDVLRLAEAIDPRWKCFVLLAAFCGLRVGELCALRASDLLLPADPTDSGSVRVSQTMTRTVRGWTQGPVKSDASVRDITVPPFLCRELAHHIEAGYSNPDYVFTGKGGGRLDSTYFREYPWAKAVRETGFKGLRIHDLRHTAVSLWIREGVSPRLIASRAGHSSVAYVFDTYGHLFGDEDELLASRMEARYQEELELRAEGRELAGRLKRPGS